MSRFKQRIGEFSDVQVEAAFKALCHEAEEILKPTMRLAAQISSAYDEIRQQSANLMTFSEVRTDPLTGVHNRRGLDDALAAQCAMMTRYDSHFSVALFDIDHFKLINDAQGHLFGDRQLQALAKVLADEARETDIVARYGGEEFLVIMPQTDLPGGCVFAERFRGGRADDAIDHQRRRGRGARRRLARIAAGTGRCRGSTRPKTPAATRSSSMTARRVNRCNRRRWSSGRV